MIGNRGLNIIIPTNAQLKSKIRLTIYCQSVYQLS